MKQPLTTRDSLQTHYTRVLLTGRTCFTFVLVIGPHFFPLRGRKTPRYQIVYLINYGPITRLQCTIMVMSRYPELLITRLRISCFINSTNFTSNFRGFVIRKFEISPLFFGYRDPWLGVWLSRQISNKDALLTHKKIATESFNTCFGYWSDFTYLRSPSGLSPDSKFNLSSKLGSRYPDKL